MIAEKTASFHETRNCLDSGFVVQHRASAWLVAHVRRILSYWAYSTFKRCIRQVRASKNADQGAGVVPCSTF